MDFNLQTLILEAPIAGVAIAALYMLYRLQLATLRKIPDAAPGLSPSDEPPIR